MPRSEPGNWNIRRSELARNRKPVPDQRERDAAVAERRRNVIVDAGAGTGKTAILVDRLVGMLAPKDGSAFTPISRIAAITFTRKAAGELRLRIRERLLQELASVESGSERDLRLRDAMAGLDTACVGTIHSFADRLLRMRPVAAWLSPSYEVVEDDAPLARETFDLLVHAAEGGTLSSELWGTAGAERAEEAGAVLRDAIAAGLKAESRESEFHVRYGLAALVGSFIRHRDVSPQEAPPVGFDAAAFRTAADEFIGAARQIRSRSAGAEWIASTAVTFERLRDCEEPLKVLAALVRLRDPDRTSATKGVYFEGDDAAWKLWKAYIGESRYRPGSLHDDLHAPAARWMASRLARILPVVVALYEKVKTRRRQLDQLDLLLKLRDLLRDDRTARREYQDMFDHIFVDEFQDTDPLQAEIVLYLCERGARAGSWEEVELSDGKLTLVGDPKQSIYRFRRADVAMYDRVCGIVAREPHLEARLSANFRSVPALIDWFNGCFARVLGNSPDGRAFDPASGTVFQQPLAAGREWVGGPAVRVVPFDFDDGRSHTAEEYRQLEGRVLARWLRWLVGRSGIEIGDPLGAGRRGVRYGDVAILAVTTGSLPRLFPWLDEEGIPYASRGGTLFLDDPRNRRFLLGLRALADRDDGVAEATLLHPPFFDIALEDLAGERARARAGVEDETPVHLREARERIRELRRRRFDRPPGATARDLLEGTGLARAVADGPNGAQRLARLHELCLVLDEAAAQEGLDYDGASGRLREWVERPIQIDPPFPAGEQAVQVLTVHQAKGLEFPVVALWDGRAQWSTRPESGAWIVERHGRAWAIDLDGLRWEEPAGAGLRETERRYRSAEKRRLIYVAATRARDLLMVPQAGDVARGQFVCRELLEDVPESLATVMEPFREGSEPAWAKAFGEVGTMDEAGPGRAAAPDWIAAARESARPRFRPVAVSDEAGESADLPAHHAPRQREERYGSRFGSTVHRAIGLVLRDGASAAEATRRASVWYGLEEHVDEAAADVGRALSALRAAGIGGMPGAALQLEYPVAGSMEGGSLVNGYIDLVAVAGGVLYVIDFKTDAPPHGAVEQAYPNYVGQVRAYGRLLENGGVSGGRNLRCGLLFTADGVLRWV
jgi:ATP-dependent helicase/nuclease subunit A